MELLILFIGFIGSWTLFAGSIYQAALELNDENIEIDRIRAAGSRIRKPVKISIWWWLVPPVRFYKEFQRGKISRAAIMKELSPEDITAMISFNTKAKAWLLVASGGICLAIKETYELSDYIKLTIVELIVLLIFMTAISIANLVYNIRHARAYKPE